jgi:hypothetical protein
MHVTITRPAGVLLLWLALASAAPAAPAWSIKTVPDQAPPKELAEPIRKLLDNRCIQLHDGRGNTVVEVWLRKEVPVKATDAQIKNGLTYREVASSTVLGALRVVKDTVDYKKQKVPAGVYTLRLGIQPADGDHMGTAPYNEFCLLCPAADDKKPDLLMVKPLRELSARTTDNHPAVLLLFPGDKDAAAEPKLLSKPGGHQVLFVRLAGKAGDRKATLALGLNLVGTSASV